MNEMEIRKKLWLGHGHTGMYGDDGEMQCSECIASGTWDYKRAPLEDVIETATLALRRVLCARAERAEAVCAQMRNLACRVIGHLNSGLPGAAREAAVQITMIGIAE